MAGFALAGVLGFAACGDADDRTSVDADAASDAAQASDAASGSGSAAAFWDAVQDFPVHDTTLYGPLPRTLEDLIASTPLAVRATIERIDVRVGTWRPFDDPAEAEDLAVNAAGRVDVMLSLIDLKVLRGDAGDVSTPFVWQVLAWLGDPTRTQGIADSIAETVGEGPVGGEVVLFATPSRDGGDSGGGHWSAYGGILESGGTSAVLFPYVSNQPNALSDVESVEQLAQAVRTFEPSE